MRNRSFRGYAERSNKGFNPLRFPDTSQRILRESERMLQGMREVQRSEINNRREMLGALRENAATEEQIHKEHGDMQMQFAKAYKEAELQPIKVQLQDIKNRKDISKLRRAEQEKAWDDIKELVPQAFKAFGKIQDARLEAANIAAKNAVTEHGLTLEMFTHQDQINKQTEAIKSGSSNLLAIKSGGLTKEQAYAISRMSGMEVASAHRLLANRYGSTGWEQFYNTNVMNSRLEDGRLYRELLSNTKDNVYKDIMAHYNAKRAEYISLLPKGEDGRPLFTDEFIAGEVKPFMNIHKESIRSTAEEQKLNNLQWQEESDVATNLESYLKSPGQSGIPWSNASENFDKLVSIYAGNDPTRIGEERRYMIKHLEHLAKNGKLPEHIAFDIIDKPTIQLGRDKAGKPTGPLQSKGTLYPEEFKGLIDIYATRNNMLEEQQEKAAESDANLVAANITTMLREGKHFSANMQNKIRELIETNGWDIDHPKFRDFKGALNAEEIEMGAAVKALDILKERQGGKLYEKDLLHVKYPAIIRERYKADISDSLDKVTNGAKDQLAAVRKVPRSILGELQDTTSSVTADRMKPYAEKLFYAHFHSEELVTKYKDPDARANAAAARAEEQMRSGVGNWKLNGKVGDGANFQVLEGNNVADQTGDILLKIDENKDYAFTPGILPEVVANKIINYGKTGNQSDFLNSVASKFPNMSVHEVARKLAAANGASQQEIMAIEAKGADRAQYYVDQEWKRNVLCHPSLAKVSRACAATALKNGEINAYNVALDAAKDPVKVNYGQGNDYDVYNAPHGGLSKGAEKWGKPVDQTSVDEILDFTRQGRADEFGPWGITGSWIQHCVDNGICSPEDAFDETIQRRIAITQMNDEVSNFRIPDGVGIGAVLPGAGHADFTTPRAFEEPSPGARALARMGFNWWLLKDNQKEQVNELMGRFVQ